jgi:hypothetical protein
MALASPPANQCLRLAPPACLGNPDSLRSGRAVATASIIMWSRLPGGLLDAVNSLLLCAIAWSNAYALLTDVMKAAAGEPTSVPDHVVQNHELTCVSAMPMATTA